MTDWYGYDVDAWIDHTMLRPCYRYTNNIDIINDKSNDSGEQLVMIVTSRVIDQSSQVIVYLYKMAL